MSRNQAILFVLGVFIAVFVPNFITSVQLTSNLREGCERGTVTRDNQTFVLNYEIVTAKVVLTLAVDEDLRAYFKSVIPELQSRADSVPIINCDESYPYPFPLNLVNY